MTVESLTKAAVVVLIVLIALAPPPLAETSPADKLAAFELATIVAFSVARIAKSPEISLIAFSMKARVELVIVFSASETPIDTAPPSVSDAASEDASASAAMVELSVAVNDPPNDSIPTPTLLVIFDSIVWPILLTVPTPAPLAAPPMPPIATAAEPALTVAVINAAEIAAWFSSPWATNDALSIQVRTPADCTFPLASKPM